jgi:drug/metabolite transporter (DMT)-like permease
MAIMTDERVTVATGQQNRATLGFALAIGSAVSFSLSGPLARGLLDTGWNPAGVVLVRIAIAALVLLPFGVRALGGDWSPLRDNWRTVTLYGVLAVAGAQFCYFSAVANMAVGPALLIEYTAPAAVVVYLWLRHGQRPCMLTVAGAGVAAVGLVFVLDLLGGDTSAAIRRRNVWVRGCCGLLMTSDLGVALLDDDAAVHEDDPVGDLAGEGHLVGDDDHRHAVSASSRMT